MSVEAGYIKRETRDVIEDYDLALYGEDTTGGTDYPGDPGHPDSLFLGLEYFAFRDASGAITPGSVGSLTNPSWTSADLRLRYNHDWTIRRRSSTWTSSTSWTTRRSRATWP